MNRRTTEMQSMNVSLQASRYGLPEPRIELGCAAHMRSNGDGGAPQAAVAVALTTPNDAGGVRTLGA